MRCLDDGTMQRAERAHGSPFPSVYDLEYIPNTPAEILAARCVITRNCDPEDAGEILGMLGLPS